MQRGVTNPIVGLGFQHFAFQADREVDFERALERAVAFERGAVAGVELVALWTPRRAKNEFLQMFDWLKKQQREAA